jgi:hypothetical protein
MYRTVDFHFPQLLWLHSLISTWIPVISLISNAASSQRLDVSASISSDAFRHMLFVEINAAVDSRQFIVEG